jgi:hypothetical protein
MNQLTFSLKPYAWTQTSVSVSPCSENGLTGKSAFCVRTGSMSLQAYITSDELRELSALMVRAANVLDAQTMEIA